MFHFSSPSEDIAACSHAGEIIDGEIAGKITLAAIRSGSESLGEPSGKASDILSLHLDHMGLAVAISASTPAVARGTLVECRDAPQQGEKALHFELQGATHAALGPIVAAAAHSAEWQHDIADDPVVQKLSRALDAAERSSDVHAGLFADALRLATIVRILSGHGAREEAKAPAPAPKSPSAHIVAGLPKWRLKRVTALVDEHLGETITLADMAAAAGLSRMYFAAQFRAATGQRPHEYLLRRRIERAQDLLLNSPEPLAQIALAIGFQTQAHFTTVFRRFVGETPYRWRCAAAAA